MTNTAPVGALHPRHHGQDQGHRRARVSAPVPA